MNNGMIKVVFPNGYTTHMHKEIAERMQAKGQVTIDKPKPGPKPKTKDEPKQAE